MMKRFLAVLASTTLLISAAAADTTVKGPIVFGTGLPVVDGRVTSGALLTLPVTLSKVGNTNFGVLDDGASLEPVIRFIGSSPNFGTSFMLGNLSGPLDLGTMSEFTLFRSLASEQTFGGNYGRWAFTAQGSSLDNVTGLFGEFGGTTPIGPFVLQVGIENPPGTFTTYEGVRFEAQAGNFASSQQGAMLFGLGATVPRNQIVLNMSSLPGAGKVDSHAVLWESKANDGVNAHPVWWRAKVETADNAGQSSFVLQQQLDNSGSWTTYLRITDAGLLSAAGLGTQSLIVTQASPASTDPCTPGQIVSDPNFIYACSLSGAWKRAALTGGY